MRANHIIRQRRWAGVFLAGLSIVVLLASGCDASSPVSVRVSASPPDQVSPQGNTYYVAPASLGGSDSNPGTWDDPWETIQHAADTLVAGDTVYIRAGTYQEQVIAQNAGSAGNYIT